MSIRKLPFSCASFVLIALVLSVTSARAQATGPFNVRTYGATGAANCTADTAGVLAAIAAIPASGGELYFPAGTYCMTAMIGFVDKSIAIRGEGQNLSIIRFDPGSPVYFNGIQLISTPTTSRYTLTVKSLTIVTNKDNPGTAIYGHYGSALTYNDPAASITDVQIKSADMTKSWTYGILLENGSRSVITNFEIDGISAEAATLVSDAAIRFAGQTLQATVAHGGITFWKDGIDFADNSEGLHVNDIEVVGVSRGVSMTPNTSNLGGPGTSIANSHFNAIDFGIFTANHGDVAISGNLIFQSGSHNYTGIYVANCGDVRVTGNTIVGNLGQFNGIIFDGIVFRNVIANNVTSGAATGIWLTAGIYQTIVIGNVNRQTTINTILDQAPVGANSVVNNF